MAFRKLNLFKQKQKNNPEKLENCYVIVVIWYFLCQSSNPYYKIKYVAIPCHVSLWYIMVKSMRNQEENQREVNTYNPWNGLYIVWKSELNRFETFETF